MTTARSFSAWLELLRIPNLFTVFGDPLAGALLGATFSHEAIPTSRLLCTALVSLLLYSCGLILNDLTDEKRDRTKNPARPLPSGHLSRTAAAIAAILCAVAALLLSACLSSRMFGMALLLLLFILLYDLILHASHQLRIPSALCMGCCRGLNLLLGTALLSAFPPLLLIPALMLTAAITWVTLLSDQEERPRIPGRSVYIAPLLLCGSWWVLLLTGGTHLSTAGCMHGMLWWIMLAFYLFSPAHCLAHRQCSPGDLKKYTGTQITALIPWQASLVALTLPTHYGAMFLCGMLFWGSAIFLSKHFYQT